MKYVYVKILIFILSVFLSGCISCNDKDQDLRPPLMNEDGFGEFVPWWHYYTNSQNRVEATDVYVYQQSL